MKYRHSYCMKSSTVHMYKDVTRVCLREPSAPSRVFFLQKDQFMSLMSNADVDMDGREYGSVNAMNDTIVIDASIGYSSRHLCTCTTMCVFVWIIIRLCDVNQMLRKNREQQKITKRREIERRKMNTLKEVRIGSRIGSKVRMRYGCVQ